MNKLDVLSYISPKMQAVLDKDAELAGDATLNDTSISLDEMRKNYTRSRAWWNEGGPQMALSFDEMLCGPYGDLPVRFYYPTQESVCARLSQGSALPAIVYVHGGGFVVGNLETHDRICRMLAQQSKVVVVAVDYRLSPESRFPHPIHEVAAVATYLHECGATYGIDGDRLSYAGDSGGAHLNLAATMYLREQPAGAHFIKCLLLYYGWFGLSDSSSMRLYGGSFDGMTEDDWRYYQHSYAQNPADLITSPLANLFLNDLSHDMPACYLAASALDPLLDDSATLAALCKEHDIPCLYDVFPGVLHAFLHYSKMLDEADIALERGARFYRQQLKLS